MSENKNNSENMSDNKSKIFENYLRTLMTEEFVSGYFDKVYIQVSTLSFITNRLFEILVQKGILGEDEVKNIATESSEAGMKDYADTLSKVTDNIIKRHKKQTCECNKEGCEHNHDI